MWQFVLQQDWVMTLKDVSDVEGASPNVLYFVQEGTDWFSNEAGRYLIIGMTMKRVFRFL